MKPKQLMLIALLVITTKSFGQFSFGVSPGIGLNSACFGYQVNKKLIPFIGFQYVHAKFNYEESGERFDYDLNRVASYAETNELSGGLYVPDIGLKYL